MDYPVIIFGANYLGKTAKEIFESNGNVVYGFLDERKELHGTELCEATVLGAPDDDGFLKLIGKKCEAFVATDDTSLRKSVVKMLNDVRHVQPVNAIHSRASISKQAQLGYGNFLDLGITVAPGVVIGSHCVMLTHVVIGVDVKVGDYVQIGAGSIISTGVTIEDDVFIGAGVTIVSGVTIGKGARIGLGSVVITAVKEGETVFGNPAQVVKA
jgi:sugar O-acyltransferase (sialic acid O-acetyltransferase NeuD family)